MPSPKKPLPFAPDTITPKQRRALRGLAHGLEPVVQVGHEGVTTGVLAAVHQALLDHELIKVRLREPEDKKGMATALASGSGACMCGLVGHTVILFRPHPKNPKLAVPKA